MRSGQITNPFVYMKNLTLYLRQFSLKLYIKLSILLNPNNTSITKNLQALKNTEDLVDWTKYESNQEKW